MFVFVFYFYEPTVVLPTDCTIFAYCQRKIRISNLFAMAKHNKKVRNAAEINTSTQKAMICFTLKIV